MTTVARLVDGALETSVVGSFTRIGPALRRLVEDWDSLATYDLRGRTVLVTGGNGGLGTAVAQQLAQLGATVHITVRSEDKGTSTLHQIREATGNEDLHFHELDLTDLDAVRETGARLADELGVLDGLVHNAGAMFSERREVDGVETTVMLHVIGPMVLTEALMPALRASIHPGRVVWMSSGGMYTERLDVDRLQSPADYQPATAYARAKRAQVVLARQLDARLGGEVVFHSMHPGWAATPGVEQSLPGFNKVMGPLFRDPAAGADTAVWLLASDEGGQRGGEFWLDRRPRSTERLPNTATTPEQAMALWQEVVELGDLDASVFAPTA